MDELLMKYFEGELSQEARLALLRKAATDKELNDELIRHQNILALTGLVPRSGDHARALNKYKEFTDAQRRKSAKRIALLTLRYAAVALVLIAGTWYAACMYFKRDAVEQPLVAKAMQSLYVPAGQRIRFTLDDGTVVWLNSRSTISYPAAFDAGERRVALEGEAYFDVAKDPARPFFISSGEMEIQALGTSFNVHNYPNEAVSSISLLEGSLKVYTKGNENEFVTLKPNEEALVNADRSIKVGPIQSPDYFLWTRGIYVFENESFGNILEKLKLYYDVNIEVRNTEMLQWRYSVKFRQRDGIREILGLMQKIYPFKMSVNEETNTITIRK